MIRRLSTIAMVALLLVLTGCAASDDEPEPDLDPRAGALLGHAQQAFRSGAYQDAIEMLDSAEVYVPELPALWFLRGQVLASLYEFDASNAAFKEALSLDPTYPSARFNIGHNAFLQSSFFATDGYRDALRHYRAEEAVLRNKLKDGSGEDSDRRGLAAVLRQIGTTYARLNLPDSAQIAYAEAIEVDSSNAQGFAWLAAMQQTAGELEAALRNAHTASDLEPNNPQHQLLIGSLLYELGRHDAALPYLDEAAKDEPWNRAAVYNLGRVLTELDRPSEAQEYLARADTLEDLTSRIERSHMQIFKEPNDPVLWENYAYLLHQAGRISEARRAIGVMRYLTEGDSLAIEPRELMSE